MPAARSLDARDGASPLQKGIACLMLATAIGVMMATANPGYWFAIVISPFFLSFIVVQLAATFETELTLVRPPIARTARKQWPRFSLLLPLYKEPLVVGQLVKAMRALDYPPESLEVIVLIETDDGITATALQQAFLPRWMTIVVVPPGSPQTKPRALNHGLMMATGMYLTVFDAEDIPDVDQLKMAVLMFESASSDVLCLQARLAIDNAPDGWLALMAAIEYATLFDSVKCGLAYSSMPVALGGTSNYFRRQDLIRLGGWDPWNVTEDADLGLRIARHRGFVMDLPSTTQEEAPAGLRAWMNQRRRWLKGWAQTGICHTRQPLQVIREMGFFSWFVAVVQVGGIVFGALTSPFFFAWVGYCAWDGSLWLFDTWIALVANVLSLAIILTGALAMIMPAVLGLRRRRLWHLIPWLITLPAYLILVSAAAWLALFDLATRPFHWLKTTHGLCTRHF